MMKKNNTKTLHLFLALLTIIFSSCNNDILDEDQGCYDDNIVDINFTFGASRAIISEDGYGDFETGDKVDVFIGAAGSKKVTLTLEEDGNWYPKLNKSDFGANDIYINAVYPASEGNNIVNGEYIFTQKQSTVDLLWAFFNSNEIPSTINMNFRHILHRVNLNLKNEDGNSLPDVSGVEIRTAGGCNISLSTGEISSYNSGTHIWSNFIRRDDIANSSPWKVFVIPQEISSLTGDDGWIKISNSSNIYLYKMPQDYQSMQKLYSGKSTNVSLSIKKEEVQVDTFANKKYWLYGINSDVYDDNNTISWDNPEPGKWIKRHLIDNGEIFFTYYRMPWMKNSGWYDCNKTFMIDGAYDSNMCWAASSSNILHWWLEMNKEYVEAYDMKYGNSPEHIKYPRPSNEYAVGKKSDIFNLFINTFKNKGAGEGITWFITGAKIHTSPMTDASMYDFPGYFHHVFKYTDIIYQDERKMSKENFTRLAKQAIEKKQVLNFAEDGNHAMTIWGVEFDSEGYVNYVYYVDNNYGDSDILGSDCRRESIIYKEDPAMNLKDQAFINGKRRISYLGTVDLRRDKWEAAFPEVKPLH